MSLQIDSLAVWIGVFSVRGDHLGEHPPGASIIRFGGPQNRIFAHFSHFVVYDQEVADSIKDAVLLIGDVVDTKNKMVGGLLAHFSKYALAAD